ncbi:MAG: hypothetical protein OXI83_17865, partial [Gemmatimonadota bacterium]|nr:hypothetical protein [Gemmatimonadota bacterium]
IAIALRAEARIFAEEDLLDSVAEAMASDGADEDEDSDDGEDGRMSGEALEEHLRRMRPEDLGRFER